MSFVLDSSVALSWCFRDEQTPETVQTLRLARDRAVFVPQLWHIEMANVLGLAVRKGRLSASDLSLALELIDVLEIHTEKQFSPVEIASLIPLMQTYNLTAYDAIYLEMAIRLSLPLATLDAGLIAAARQADVALVSLAQ